MKTITLIIGSLLCLSTSFLNCQNFKTASDYLKFVGNEQDEITRNMWKYTKAIAHTKSERDIENRRKRLLKTVTNAIVKIEKTEGFDGNDYKVKVLRHLNFNKDLLNQDYEKIIDMKAVAEQSYDAMEAYILAQELAKEKIQESQLIYETDFQNFADKNNIEIIDDETDLGKKMKISNQVFSYYNDLYLTYFKVYINEIYLMDALEKSDVGAIQQNANALNTAAKEGLEMLDLKAPYKKDNSIIEATKKAFEFFIEESSTKVPQITEFLLMNEEFETIRNTLDQFPERERTSDQIADYNKKVKQINTGITNYNKINTELNTKRQEVINNLNNTNAKFLDRHVPND